LLRILLELLERPVRFRRTKTHVGVEALDPAPRVLLLAAHPVRRTRVPEMEVAINDEVLLSVPLVHIDLPQSTARSAEFNLLRGWWDVDGLLMAFRGPEADPGRPSAQPIANRPTWR